ncbi:MAG: sensor histidine kinase [Actinomycetota bacterium]
MAAANRTVDWLRRHPVLADGAFAVGLLMLAIVATANADVVGTEREIDALAWVLLAGTCIPLAVRRIYPVMAAWAMLSANAPYWVLDYPDEATGLTLLIGVYSVAAHVERPRSLKHGLGLISTIVLVGVAGVITPDDDLPWFAIPAFVIMYGTAWILGDNVRTRRAYMLELERTAAHAEAQRQAEARHAVADERTRIARELHDVVAHSMSVMVVQAGAARRVLDANPRQAADALEAIETTGRESLDEMRRILGVLRSDEDELDLAPAPNLDDFGRLVDHCEQAGLPVTVTVQGDPVDLPASLELSAYRIVQESLTNTLKHAGPARANVALNYRESDLQVRVEDDGHGAAASTDRSGAGQGLVGMRERVEAFGGTLAAGPRPGGGFAVTAVLPFEDR